MARTVATCDIEVVARIDEAVEVDQQELDHFLGAEVHGGMRLAHTCMHQREGFRRPAGGAHIEWLTA